MFSCYFNFSVWKYFECVVVAKYMFTTKIWSWTLSAQGLYQIAYSHTIACLNGQRRDKRPSLGLCGDLRLIAVSESNSSF